MSKQQEQSVRKPNLEAQADARKGSKRVLFFSTALGIIALAFILWWIA